MYSIIFPVHKVCSLKGVLLIPYERGWENDCLRIINDNDQFWRVDIKYRAVDLQYNDDCNVKPKEKIDLPLRLRP